MRLRPLPSCDAEGRPAGTEAPLASLRRHPEEAPWSDCADPEGGRLPTMRMRAEGAEAEAEELAATE
eukprot:14412117-Alexandrium_andersonii.AAC.1